MNKPGVKPVLIEPIIQGIRVSNDIKIGLKRNLDILGSQSY